MPGLGSNRHMYMRQKFDDVVTPLKNRRLCIINRTHWTARVGGSQYQLRYLLDELRKMNQFDIYYLTRETNPSYKPSGYKIILFSNARTFKISDHLYDSVRLIQTLKKIQPDVIYQRESNALSGAAAYSAKNNKCRMVWHAAHDYDLSFFKLRPEKRIFFKFLDKKIGEFGIRNSDSIVVQTKQQRDLLKRNYGRQPTAIISNFHPIPAQPVEKELPVKILWVANFRPIKRPELFVSLAEDLSDLKGVEFIMIGRAGSRDRYRYLQRRIQRIKNLRYLGKQSLDEVNERFAQAHIFVNTSLAEGFPNTFIQAWMRKVPVVSLNINTDGIFDNKQLGFYSETYEKMVEDVVSLIENADLRTKMGKCAQQYAYAQHSLKNAEKLISLLQA